MPNSSETIKRANQEVISQDIPKSSLLLITRLSSPEYVASCLDRDPWHQFGLHIVLLYPSTQVCTPNLGVSEEQGIRNLGSKGKVILKLAPYVQVHLKGGPERGGPGEGGAWGQSLAPWQEGT